MLLHYLSPLSHAQQRACATNNNCLLFLSGSQSAASGPEDLAEYLQRMNKQLEEMTAQHQQVRGYGATV